MVSTVKHNAFSRKTDLPSLKVMALTSEEGKRQTKQLFMCLGQGTFHKCPVKHGGRWAAAGILI